jgi:hypothetical protein
MGRETEQWEANGQWVLNEVLAEQTVVEARARLEDALEKETNLM